MSAALLAASATAIQAHTLDGIVKDNKTGEPLIGTVIRVKELPNVGTTTGLDGSFTLHELPDKGKYTLVVTFMAYKTKEIVVDVANDEKVDIPMDEDLKQLGEVVVTECWQRAQRDEPAEHPALARCQRGKRVATCVGCNYGA